MNDGADMLNVNIEADEIYVKDLFSEKYLFEIPNFQRPFSWQEDNFKQLFEDIAQSLRSNKKIINGKLENNIRRCNPYFIGSIILCTTDFSHDGSGKYKIIDGQQRLTSLTILMAVMRDLAVTRETKEALSNKIYQEGNRIAGIEESMRLKVRDKELDFFKKYVLKDKGTLKIDEADKKNLNEAKTNIVTAINIFQSSFQLDDGSVNQDLINEFATYLLQKVVLVTVKTDSLYSAFRLFNVINARGMPLTNADLLKSENLRAIRENAERERYATIWENIEEEVGREGLERLIGFIRSIKVKEKAQSSVYEEFDKIVFKQEPDFKGKKFINYLNQLKEIYETKIIDGAISVDDRRKSVYYHNLISLMKDFLSFKDWMIGVIKFSEKFTDKFLYRFLQKFERKVAVDWVIGLSLTERLTQIFKVVQIIEDKNDPEEVLKTSILNSKIKQKKNEFVASVDDVDFYKRGRWQIPKYILLRIDMERKYNESVRERSYAKNISVEHILPRKASRDYWKERFNNEMRYEWTNKFGNLVPLNGRKNTSASNKPFTEKVELYFEKKSDFDLVDELKKYDDWNLVNLKERHNSLIDEAVNIWIK